MRLVLVGAPGVGKGTQAELASSRFKIPKISTGDLLRDAVRQQTALGIQAKKYMDCGELVADSVVIGLVQEKLSLPEASNGFILDGFPRTVAQADILGKWLESKSITLDRVLYFVIPDKSIVERLSGRRSCPVCQSVFHVESRPPKVQGTCDRCGTELIQRNDDRRETVESRMRVYTEQTAPLIEYYKEKNVLTELDGSGSVDSVHTRLVNVLTHA